MRPFLLALAATLSQASCGSDAATSTAPDGFFFVSGHGVRALSKLSTPNDGSIAVFETADITLSDPNKVEWIYGLTSSFGDPTLTRVSLDLITGAPIGTPETPKDVPGPSLLIQDSIRFVPYTDKLYYFAPYQGFYSVVGVNGFTAVGGSIQSSVKVYANGDALNGEKGGYYTPGSPDVYSSDWGVTLHVAGTPGAKTLRHRHQVSAAPAENAKLYRAAGFENIGGGEVIGFGVSGEAIVARSMRDDIELANLPFDGLSRIFTDLLSSGVLPCKRSRDGLHVACMLKDRASGRDPVKFTTFTYDVASKKIDVVLRAMTPAGMESGFDDTSTFDVAGNLYFGANITAGQGLKVIKQTSLAQQVLATGFLPDNAYVGLQRIKEVDGRIFLSFAGKLEIGASDKVSDGSKLILGVIE